jgi:hypothetical protein
MTKSNIKYKAGTDFSEKAVFFKPSFLAYPSALELGNIRRISAIKGGFDKMGSW